MKSSTVRELHLKTSEILRAVADGDEIRPVSDRPRRSMPDREALIMSGPETLDSGLILEQDRT